MSTPKVLILTGDAGESLEVMYPYQRLKEEGYDVQIAALSKKKLRFVVHDFEPGYDTYTEKPGYSWDADLAFKDVNPADYAAVVIPGGRAPEYIRTDRAVQRIIRHFFDEEKPVAQLCHAPLALAAAGVLKGRRTAAYPAPEPDVKAAGAPHADSGARARRQGGRRHFGRFRRVGRRRDGLGPCLARPPGLDAGVHSPTAQEGARRQQRDCARPLKRRRRPSTSSPVVRAPSPVRTTGPAGAGLAKMKRRRLRR